ncbi:MAG TPA: Ku protein [Steroidobacteraceae bacterium]|nr:Ku protein [Steroidobacteraceae bacterium]
MARAIWKGAISFGLVYIPVELHPASRSGTLELHLLDSRDFAPVGYERVNKRTGESVAWNHIVKGYEYKKGEYVALSEEDFRQANVKASQTLELETFTDAGQITPEYFETPYYLSPTKGGEKVYSLLRETLRKSGKVGVGSFVMRGRQHLCMITAEERVLMLVTLRFAQEIRSLDEVSVPSAQQSKISAREVAMAEKLVEQMSAPWRPEKHHDTYREDLMERIQEKIHRKQTHVLTPREKPSKEARPSAQVIDLMSVLKKSLESHGGQHSSERAAARRAPKRASVRHRRRA